jgi:hypothetical protein
LCQFSKNFGNAYVARYLEISHHILGRDYVCIVLLAKMAPNNTQENPNKLISKTLKLSKVVKFETTQNIN